MGALAGFQLLQGDNLGRLEHCGGRGANKVYIIIIQCRVMPSVLCMYMWIIYVQANVQSLVLAILLYVPS